MHYYLKRDARQTKGCVDVETDSGHEDHAVAPAEEDVKSLKADVSDEGIFANAGDRKL